MVLTNTGITPRSHNLKQLKNASRQFPVKRIPITIRLQHFFCILSVSFCFCKICINNTFRRNIAEVSISRRARDTTRT